MGARGVIGALKSKVSPTAGSAEVYFLPKRAEEIRRQGDAELLKNIKRFHADVPGTIRDREEVGLNGGVLRSRSRTR